MKQTRATNMKEEDNTQQVMTTIASSAWMEFKASECQQISVARFGRQTARINVSDVRKKDYENGMADG